MERVGRESGAVNLLVVKRNALVYFSFMHQFTADSIISGFRVKSVTPLPEYKAQGISLEHIRTGFQVYFVDSEDSECFFSYTAYTPPSDSKGIPHIIEHTVLSGSRKYPVKDPFMLLVRNSCNTFLNALTGVDRTYFPGASTVAKDFDNLFSVYTDAVFSPLLREETFMQEGIRIASEGGLHFEGVVFSEMLGEMAEHGYVLSSASTRPLFGSSPYQYESGGDARAICRLRYDEYLGAYRRFYAPANLSLFFYGDMDITDKLELLDREYLSVREKGEKIPRIAPAARWDAPRRYDTVSSAEDGESDSSVMVSWLLGDNAVPGESTLLSLMVDILLGSPGCPLYKAITESGLGKDLSSESGMSSSYRDLVFSAGFSGSDPDDAGKIEEFIVSALRRIAEDGLDPRAVEAAIRRMEFSTKEIPGGIPQGMRLFFQAEKAMTFGGDPALFLAPGETIRKIREKWRDDPRFFEKWMLSSLVDNPHRLLTVVRKDSSHGREIESEIASVLEERRGEYSEEKEKKFLSFLHTPDSPEAVASVPRLKRDDLPRRFDRIEHTVCGRIVSAPMRTGGIVYTDIVFDISDFSYDDLDAADILSRLFSMCDAGGMDYSSVSTELRFVTGGYAFYVESGSAADGKEKVFLVCRVKSLPELQREGLDLILKVLLEGRVDDPARIKAALTDIATDFSSSVVQSGQTYASSLAAAALSPSLYIGERLSGVSCWYKVEELLSSDLSEFGKRLAAIRERIITEKRVMIHVTAENEDEEKALAAASAFLSVLPEGEAPSENCIHAVPSLPVNTARTLSSSVSFIGIAGSAPGMDDPLSSAERIFLSILSSTVLWKSIREKGGAYGTGAYIDYTERYFTFYSYRDPRLDGTIDDFLSSPDEAEITKENLDDAVIGVLSRDLKPSVPAIRSLVDIRRIIYRISDEDRERKQREIAGLSPEDAAAAGRRFAERIKRGVRIAVIGDRKAIEESERTFDVMSLPQ